MLENIVSVIPEILLYIVPGFVTQKIIETFTPRKKLPEFETILWSLFYSFLVAIVVDVLKWIYMTMGLGTDFLKNDDFRSTVRVCLYLVCSAGIGFMIVKGTNSALGAKVVSLFNKNMAPGEDVWNKTLKAKNGQWARVITRDGMVYYGAVVDYTCNPDDSVRFIVLSRYKWGPVTKADEMIKSNVHKVIEDYTENTPANQMEKVILNYEDIAAIQLDPGK